MVRLKKTVARCAKTVNSESSFTSHSFCPCQTFSSHISLNDPVWLPLTANQSPEFNISFLFTLLHHFSLTLRFLYISLTNLFTSSHLILPLYLHPNSSTLVAYLAFKSTPSHSTKVPSSHLCLCLASTSNITVAVRKKRRPTAAET